VPHYVAAVAQQLDLQYSVGGCSASNPRRSFFFCTVTCSNMNFGEFVSDSTQIKRVGKRMNERVWLPSWNDYGLFTYVCSSFDRL
jgi:hypothetical protein